jgi:hypothetical protein
MSEFGKCQDFSAPSGLRHAQQEETPQPPDEKPPEGEPEGMEQPNMDIFFSTSFEPQEGQTVSLSAMESLRIVKASLHFKHVYS